MVKPWHCIATISPWHPAENVRVDINACSAALREITGLGDVPREPAMVDLPSMGISLFDGAFGAAVAPGDARFSLSMRALRRSHPWIDATHLASAPVEIRVGRVGDAWPWRRVFRGRVATFSKDNDTLALSSQVDAEPFAAKVLAQVYAGTGGAEGNTDLKDQEKPLIIGHALNVEPVLIDAVDSVYQFSAYGRIQAIDVLYERAADFGPPVADHPSFAALLAAAVPRGAWATCLAEGLIRLGAPAAGVITGDVRGHMVGDATPLRTGSVIAALADIAGVPADLVALETLSALDDDVPFPIGLVLKEQATFADVARRLALPCNYQAGIALDGLFFVTGIGIGEDPDLWLDAQGKSVPQVLEQPQELTVSAPFAKTMFGGGRNWRVHSMEEIAFDADLIPLGRWNPATLYRYGNIVTMPDLSEWIYIGAGATLGNAPPTWPETENAWWENMTPPASATDLTYADGTPIEDLKPAEPGSTVGAPPGTPVGDREATQVISDLDALGGQVIEQAGVLLEHSGKLTSYWQVEAIAGGRAQLRVYSESNGGGGVDIVGDLRVDGNVLISGTVTTNALLDGAVATDKIASNAASKIAYAESGLVYLTNNVEITCATLVVTKDRADSVLKIMVHANARLEDNTNRTNIIRVDGDIVWQTLVQPSGDDTTYATEACVTILAGLAAGSHTVTFSCTITNGATPNASYMNLTFLDVEERKR